MEARVIYVSRAIFRSQVQKKVVFTTKNIGIISWLNFHYSGYLHMLNVQHFTEIAIQSIYNKSIQQEYVLCCLKINVNHFIFPFTPKFSFYKKYLFVISLFKNIIYLAFIMKFIVFCVILLFICYLVVCF